MYNVEDMDGFEIDTGKNIYMFICLLYVSIVYLFAQCLKNDFVLNGIVEIASVCLMPIEEDPSTVVLDDDK